MLQGQLWEPRAQQALSGPLPWTWQRTPIFFGLQLPHLQNGAAGLYEPGQGPS